MPAFPRMRDRLLDPRLALAIAGVSLLELQLPSMTDDARAPFVVVLLCAPVVLRRRAPVVALLCLTAVGVLTPHFAGGFPSTPSIATALIFYSSAAHARSRWTPWAALVTFLALEATIGIPQDALVPLMIGAIGSYWIGLQVRKRRETVEVLSQRAKDIEAEEDAFKRLSVRRERARIARELHDIVSHHLAMIVVQAGAGRIATAGGPGPARTRFSAIRSGGEQALSELARLVDVLSRDGERTDRMASLLDQAIARGLALRVSNLPATGRLPAEVQDAAYRVVQEGLTNAVKHAPGGEVRVRFLRQESSLEIELRDGGGDGPPLAVMGSGSGLTGMRDRVEELGGELDAGPAAGGGWTLRAVLPLGAPVAVGAAGVYPLGMT